jgi:phosphohistidine phosphatase
MELMIIRHAKAEAHGHPEGDAARALVAKGEEQSERLGRFLVRSGRMPEVILSSPMVRARQTAERMCAAAALSAPVIQSWLACGMDPETAMQELVAWEQVERVALIGHEPDLSGLIEHLVGGQAGSVEVKKASLTGLDVSLRPRKARLLYHVPPSMQGK